MRYEGDIPSGWGNLSGREMASYFWMAGLRGTYPTHGETLQNNSDDSTEVRWWAKGGFLIRKSIERIDYFKQIMEEVPVQDTGKKKQEYFLAHVADSAQTIALDLPGESGYQLEVIDTWNMKILETSSIAQGSFEYLTVFPYTAIRIIR